jgi:hypothetical protein
MKDNHKKLIGLIQQAISQCSYDDTLLETKRLLKGALSYALAVGKKRDRRTSEQKALQDKALKKQTEWWNTIKDNVGQLPEIKEEEKPKD